MAMHVEEALDRLQKAEAARDKAEKLRGVLEQHRDQMPSAANLTSEAISRRDSEISECQKEVDYARAAVVEAKPTCMPEAMRKMRALIGTDIKSGDVNSIKQDIDALLTKDPVVDMCKRWRLTDEYIQQAYEEAGKLPPEVIEARETNSRLRERILSMTPTSPEGLAGFMDLLWDYHEPGFLVGTENWLESMENSGVQMLLRARHAAYLLAGKGEH